MNKEAKEIVVLTCPCGVKVKYNNPNQGAINVGHLRKQTGWRSLHNTFDYSSIWVCPNCAIEK